ncbi:MAG TPA: hypothetical protein VGA67_04455 [Candidatus Dojkabacteria bacterium]|jgi:hypothetical protein
MKDKRTIIIFVSLILIFVVCPLCILAVGFFYWKGGVYVPQKNAKIEITNGAESPQIIWTSTPNKKQFSTYTDFYYPKLSTEAIGYNMKETIFGAPGSEVDVTVSDRIVIIDRETGDIGYSDADPSALSGEDVILPGRELDDYSIDYTVTFPFANEDFTKIEILKGGVSVWSIDATKEDVFSALDISDYYLFTVDEYLIVSAKIASDKGCFSGGPDEVFFFNIETKNLAWKITMDNDCFELGDFVFKDGDEIFLLVENGSIIKLEI